MKQFIITGCPRSGTKYTARVFSELGIECDHEELFGIEAVEHDIPKIMKRGGVLNNWGPSDGPPIYGEASWMAVPFLSILGPNILVLHQMRHPIDTVRSMYAVGLFRDDRERGKRYTNFIRNHTENVFQYKNEIDRGFAFWMEWTRRVDKLGISKCNIEILDAPYIKLIADLVECEVSIEQVKEVLDNIEKTINQSKWQEDARKKVVEKINWDSITNQKLKREAQELAKRHGYK